MPKTVQLPNSKSLVSETRSETKDRILLSEFPQLRLVDSNVMDMIETVPSRNYHLMTKYLISEYSFNVEADLNFEYFGTLGLEDLTCASTARTTRSSMLGRASALVPQASAL